MIFSLNYFHVQEKIWTTSSEAYLQSFANNLPNIFTNSLSISQSYCARKSGGTIFKTTQLPIRGGEVWSQER